MATAKRCVTVGRVGSQTIRIRGKLTVCIWGVKVYVLKPRKSDGVYTWRLESAHCERSGINPSAKLVRIAKQWAADHELEFKLYITQNEVCQMSDLEKIVYESDLNKSAEGE